MDLWANLKLNFADFAAGMTQVQALVTSVNTQARNAAQQMAGVGGPNVIGSIQQLRNTLVGASVAVDALATGMDALAVGMINAFRSQEAAFAGIRKTINATEDEFQTLKSALTDLSNRTPVKFEDLSKIGELAGQLGVRGTENIIKFTDTIARIAVSTNLSTEAAATAFARLSNIMQEPISNIDKTASAVVALGNNFATTEAEIVNFALRIAGAGKIAGLTTADILGIGAAFTSVGVKAEAGGTAIQKMLIDMTEAVAQGNEHLRLFAMLTGQTTEEFSKLFKTNPGKAFQEVVEGFKAAGDKAFAFLEAITGNNARVVRAFLSTANAGELLGKAMEMAGLKIKDTSALMNESERRFATFDSTMKELTNAFNNFAAALGETLMPILRPLAMAATEILIGFQKLPEPIRAFIAITLAASAVVLTLTGVFITGLAIFTAVGAALAEVGLTVAGVATVMGAIIAVITGVGLAVWAVVKALGAFKGPEGMAGAGQAAVDAGKQAEESKGMWASLGEGLQYTADTFRGLGIVTMEVADTVWQATKDIASGAWDYLKNAALGVIDVIKGLWDTLVPDWAKNAIKEFGLAILHDLVDTFNLLKMALQPIISAIQYLEGRGRAAREKAASEAREKTNEMLREQARGESLSLRQKEDFNRNFDVLDANQVKDRMRALGLQEDAEKNMLSMSSNEVKLAFENKLINQDQYLEATKQGLEDEQRMTFENFQIEYGIASKALKDRDQLIAAAIKKYADHYTQLHNAQRANDLAIQKAAVDYAYSSAQTLDAEVARQHKAADEIVAARIDMNNKIIDMGKSETAQFISQQQDQMAASIANFSKQAEVLDQDGESVTGLGNAFGEMGRAIVQATLKAIEFKDKGISEKFSAQLRAAELDAKGLAASVGLLGEAAAQAYYAFVVGQTTYDKLSEKDKRLVDELAQIKDKYDAVKQAAQDATLAQDLFMAGMDKVEAGNLAAQVDGIRRMEALQDTRLKALTDYNEAYEKMADNRAKIDEQEAIKEGNVLGVMTARMRRFALESDNVWVGMGKLIDNVLGNIQRSLSDVLFDFFTKGTFNLKDAWKSLMNSMLRDLSNFLAQQAVREFLKLVLGDFGGSSGGSILGGSAAAGAGATGSLFGGSGGLLGGLLSAGGNAVSSLWDSIFSSGSTEIAGGITSQVLSSAGNVASETAADTATNLLGDLLGSFGFAGGGPVPGRGHGDVVPAMLEPGEFVVNKQAAAQYRAFLDSINGPGSSVMVDGRLYMATGGQVSLSGLSGMSLQQLQLMNTLNAATTGMSPTQAEATIIAILTAILQQQKQATAATQQTATATQQTAQTLDQIASPIDTSGGGSGMGGGGLGGTSSVNTSGITGFSSGLAALGISGSGIGLAMGGIPGLAANIASLALGSNFANSLFGQSLSDSMGNSVAYSGPTSFAGLVSAAVASIFGGGTSAGFIGSTNIGLGMNTPANIALSGEFAGLAPTSFPSLTGLFSGPSPNVGSYSGSDIGLSIGINTPSTFSGIATGVGTGNASPGSTNFGGPAVFSGGDPDASPPSDPSGPIGTPGAVDGVDGSPDGAGPGVAGPGSTGVDGVDGGAADGAGADGPAGDGSGGADGYKFGGFVKRRTSPRGGKVHGPMAEGDNIMAWVQAGEFIIPRRLANRDADPLRRYLRTGLWPGQEKKVNNIPGTGSVSSKRRMPPEYYKTPDPKLPDPLVPPDASDTAQSVTHNISIVVNGNVDDPGELARKLAPMLRDELKRIDPRYSRAGNKTQA